MLFSGVYGYFQEFTVIFRSLRLFSGVYEGKMKKIRTRTHIEKNKNWNKSGIR